MSPSRRGPARGRRQRFIPVETLSVSAIRTGTRVQAELKRYQWEYWAALRRHRAENADEIRAALHDAAVRELRIEHWQRIVRYKWALDPLSALGSMLITPGGRFNFGKIDAISFPPFGAIYLAENARTAEAEFFAVVRGQRRPGGLSGFDLIQTPESSVTRVSVSGVVGRLIDLREPASLKAFTEATGNFAPSPELKAAAARLRLPARTVARTPEELLAVLNDADWRLWTSLFDLPSPSQEFGQLARAAGIQAIVYPSSRGEGDCLVVFPDNFESSASRMELDDESPEGMKRRFIDASNWRTFVTPISG